MEKELCACSKLEWLPEHYPLEHHPDCEIIKRRKLVTQESVDYLSQDIVAPTKSRIDIEQRGTLIIKRTMLQFFRNPDNPQQVTEEIEVHFELTGKL